MKKSLLFTSFFVFSLFSWGQVTNQGEPKSWKIDIDQTSPIVLPDFDLAQLQAEDAVNDLEKNKPWRFGYEHSVSYGLDNAGKWTELPNGDRVWLIGFKSEGAKTLNFIFDEFYLPEDATLYFYNDERTDLLGAYTHTQNREDKAFGSWLVEGDMVWVEYYEPKHVKNQGALNIDLVVHGYRSITENEIAQKSLNSSGPCNHDVDCDVGDDFNDKKDVLKRSVALIVVNNSGFCTGTLINNTENDETPYFLTADHCIGSTTSNWAFRFNWTSNNPQCGTFTNSTNGSFNQTLSGSNIVARNSGSDFALLEITAPIQESWDLVWAGWDRSTAAVDYAVGIHHPAGDIMKVCRDDDSPYMQSIQGIQVWFLDQWELGVTEGGSSGSALFNPDGRIMGQLLGGAAACAGTNNNGQFDFYGRFDVSWDSNMPSRRLKDWLDPNNTNVMTIDSHPPMESLSSVSPEQRGLAISLYPNPTSGVTHITNESGSAINYQVFNIGGKLIHQGKAQPTGDSQLDFTNLNSGIYLIKFTNEATNETSTQKLIVK